jgi:hypothetical protein
MKLLKSRNSPSTTINNLEVKWYSPNVPTNFQAQLIPSTPYQ